MYVGSTLPINIGLKKYSELKKKPPKLSIPFDEGKEGYMNS